MLFFSVKLPQLTCRYTPNQPVFICYSWWIKFLSKHRSTFSLQTQTMQLTPHLLVDVDVTGVNAISEKVFRAAVTAAQVAVMEQLPAQTQIHTLREYGGATYAFQGDTLLFKI